MLSKRGSRWEFRKEESEKSLLEEQEEVGICPEIATWGKSPESFVFCGDGSREMWVCSLALTSKS